MSWASRCQSIPGGTGTLQRKVLYPVVVSLCQCGKTHMGMADLLYMRYLQATALAGGLEYFIVSYACFQFPTTRSRDLYHFVLVKLDCQECGAFSACN